MFFDEVVAPIIRDLIRLVLKSFGPKAPGELHALDLTLLQTKVAADIEETLTLFAQRRSIGNTLRDAMPKAFYWFGTALLGNWVVATCMDAALAKKEQAIVKTTVDRECLLLF